MATTDGRVNPIQAATPPSIAGPQRPDGDAELAARRPGQHLGERHEVAEGRIVEPAAPSTYSRRK